MKTVSGLIVAGSLALAAPAAADTTWNMSIWISQQAPFVQQAMLPWAKQVGEVTEGRVEVRVLPKAVTNPQQHFDAVRDGLADVTFIVHGYTPGRFDLAKLAELPFTGDSAEALSVAYQRVQTQQLDKANEHAGVKLLSVFTHGPGHIYTATRPATSMDDLSGMKFRTSGGMINDIARLLGVTGIAKPSTEVYEMLANGVADGVFFTNQSILTFKLAPVIKTATFVPGGLYNTSFALIMNPAKFEALSAADQEAVMSISGERFSRMAGKAFDQADRDGLEVLKAQNVQMTTASPEFTADLRKAVAPVVEDWIKEADAKGIDGAAAVRMLNEEISAAGASN